jgi:hypothetical protein
VRLLSTEIQIQIYSKLHVLYEEYRTIEQILHKLRYKPKKDKIYTLITIRRVPFKAMIMIMMTAINGLWRKRG